jgi:hypothetical protein
MFIQIKVLKMKLWTVLIFIGYPIARLLRPLLYTKNAFYFNAQLNSFTTEYYNGDDDDDYGNDSNEVRPSPSDP